MAKVSGGCRVLTIGSRQYNRRAQEFRDLMGSGKYSSGYFSEKGGGYYVVENSRAKHKDVELKAAEILADNGYKVTLIDEAGSVATPDGKIFTTYFEQSTPEGNSVNNFKGTLNHALEKPNTTAAVVYQKKGTHSKETIRKAIEDYSKYSPRKLDVYVLTRDGRIHHWRTHE